MWSCKQPYWFPLTHGNLLDMQISGSYPRPAELSNHFDKSPGRFRCTKNFRTTSLENNRKWKFCLNICPGVGLLDPMVSQLYKKISKTKQKKPECEVEGSWGSGWPHRAKPPALHRQPVLTWGRNKLPFHLRHWIFMTFCCSSLVDTLKWKSAFCFLCLLPANVNGK